MTEHEVALARALGNCTYVPGSSHKRFARNMAFLVEADPARELTDQQRSYMEIMAWRYRRQMPRSLVPHQKPIDLPPKRKASKVTPTPSLITASEQLDLL